MECSFGIYRHIVSDLMKPYKEGEENMGKQRISFDSGMRFGRLTIVDRTDDIINSRGIKFTAYLCKCDCGKTLSVKATRLKSGKTQSCGCWTSEKLRNAKIKHDCSGKNNRLYEIWKGMKARCYNPNHTAYGSYGGRGIRVCDEWLHDFTSFRQWALSHGYNDLKSIDRIDSNNNYCPENCRWADSYEQANNKRNSRILECCGKSQTLSQWAYEVGVARELIRDRIDRLGWGIERAIFTPPRKIHRNMREVS